MFLKQKQFIYPMTISTIVILTIIIFITYIITAKLKRKSKITTELSRINKRSELEYNNVSKNCTTIKK